MISKVYVVFTLVLVYFLLPKFDLFFVPGSVTGIRVQDIICLFLFFVLFKLKVNINILLTLIVLLLHLIYSIIVWDSFTSIYGFFRLIEYYFVAKGIVFIIEKGYWESYFNYIFIYLIIFSIFQYFLLLPNIDPGRAIIYSSQFSGSFGTPAELTYFVIAILYLNYQVNKLSTLNFMIASLVLFNGVKAGIIGFIILIQQQIIRSNIIIIILLGLLSILFSIILFNYILIGIEFLKAALFFNDSQTYHLNEESLSLRINKWSYSLSLLYQEPVALFFGFGVYSYTSALDGGILKFLFEFGLFGFLFITHIIFKTSKSFLLIVLAISLFFDSYTSSVVMPVLISTYLIFKNQSKLIQNEK